MKPTPEQIAAAKDELRNQCEPKDHHLVGDLIHFVRDQNKASNILLAALEAAEADGAALDAWRASALAVEKEWDAQEVGKLLSLKPGDSIRAGIAPAVKELQAQNELLYATLEAVSKSDWWTGGMGVYDSKTKARLNKQIETALAARKEART